MITPVQTAPKSQINEQLRGYLGVVHLPGCVGTRYANRLSTLLYRSGRHGHDEESCYIERLWMLPEKEPWYDLRLSATNYRLEVDGHYYRPRV